MATTASIRIQDTGHKTKHQIARFVEENSHSPLIWKMNRWMNWQTKLTWALVEKTPPLTEKPNH
jgi:hypothetical protein